MRLVAFAAFLILILSAAVSSASEGPAEPTPARMAPRKDQDRLILPHGFSAEIFARGLKTPRALAAAPNGDVFVLEAAASRLSVLRDLDGGGQADLSRNFARGFDRPAGLAVSATAIFIADARGLWRLDYRPGDLKGAPRRALTRPGALGPVGGEPLRALALSETHDALAIGIGNLAPRYFASAPPMILRYGQLRGLAMLRGGFAAGALAYHPETNDLLVATAWRAGAAEGTPHDAFFSLPLEKAEGSETVPRGPPQTDEGRQMLRFDQGANPAAMVIYDGGQFPAAYRGNAFVALAGTLPGPGDAGFKVVHVPLLAGTPAGPIETFIAGFTKEGQDRIDLFGRPSGLAVGLDGALYVSDDFGGAVWRITYARPTANDQP